VIQSFLIFIPFGVWDRAQFQTSRPIANINVGGNTFWTMKKVWDNILKVWKDPVWSKVIASGLIFLIATIWTKYSNYSVRDILKFLADILTVPFPLYLTLSIIGVLLLIRFVIQFFKSRRTHPIWDEQIGNYKFKELYSILQGQVYKIQTVGMKYAGRKAPVDNLLILFMAYAPKMNKGVTLDSSHDDSGYLYGVLCPKFVSYGLVIKTIIREQELGDVELLRYETSDLGHKFHSLVEKVNRLQEKKKS
jgi:uncharacterized membrane protein